MSVPFATETEHFADADAAIPGVLPSGSTPNMPSNLSYETQTAHGTSAPPPLPALDASSASHPAQTTTASAQPPPVPVTAALSAPAVHTDASHDVSGMTNLSVDQTHHSAAEINSGLGIPSGLGAAPVAVATPAIICRKLTSFVGFSNLPQQWHQKSIRQGFDLNLMVIGESGLGKSTLLNTLFEVPVHDLDTPHHYDSSEYASTSSGSSTSGSSSSVPKSHQVNISTTKIELNESGVRLRLSVIDTPGYGDHINNVDSWKSIADEIDSRFDQYLESENSLAHPVGGAQDPRVHACLFFLDPTGHSLKPLDVVVMKKLSKKVNLVPVIAKADTQTEEELQRFKHAVLADLRHQDITIFEPPVYEFDDEETTAELSDLKQRVPFAVIGSTQLVVNRNGNQVLGREYPWGVVEVMNEDHSDFVKLRSLLIRNHMEDLRESTDTLYENYRTEKMIELGVKQDDSVFDMPDPSVRLEEERRQHEERLAKMEAEMRAVFQQKVAEKETKLKSSENELFQKHREIKEQLDRQRVELEQRRQQLQMQLDSKRKVVR